MAVGIPAVDPAVASRLPMSRSCAMKRPVWRTKLREAEKERDDSQGAVDRGE